MKIGIPKDGRFGDLGGKYIPETLAPAIEELEKNYLKIRNDPISVSYTHLRAHET